MPNVVIGREGEEKITPSLMEQMFRLRYEVFHEKLGWQVDGTNQQERDDFDYLNPVYMIAGDLQSAKGCWRLLPTTGPNMLFNTFPVLLRGEAMPQADSIWELSRFAVTSPSRRYKGQIYLSELTYAMIEQLINFADDNHIEQYVTVTSVAVERLMKRCDIPMIRFGDAQSTVIGGVDSVACWIPVNQQFRNAVTNANEMLKTA
jgi:acyl homoserine lactone synthase